jgi:hypothetical protein
MLIADMMEASGRVFLKSEFGPIGEQWPCFSFTKKPVGRRLQSEYRPGRDIVVYVGTTSAETTEDPDHRSRILSALSIEPNHILETRRIVPEDVWATTIAQYGENPWPYSMAVIDAALTQGPPFPEARALIPKAYASFAAMENRGNVVEALGDERAAVMALPVERISLQLSQPVLHYMQLMGAVSGKVERTVKQEAARLALLIQNRVNSGGERSVRINPQRTAPNVSDLVALIIRKWTVDQKGKCALCLGPLTQEARAHKMLQVSADRVDSDNGAYNDGNLQVTHLACNWAKNQYGAEAFADWLAVVQDARALEMAAVL